ncbi:PREDICTED: UPF0554 protein C2orf43 homolog isoform X2 [Elephantulus edwardii]|uniref:UPF0554 protein C2orf43 homolog isoform X2 n=1 Tax=Elephantulus edwardii TaxID=28737 RepID=UPI0003F05FFB|nr:PREDICTED: UPF0554 protein C2orf43 homolog isoform X2 [Elephantulus edwardii]
MDTKVMDEIPVQEEFVSCGGIETQLLKCGPWTDLFNDQSACKPKVLILIITDKEILATSNDSNTPEIKDAYGHHGQIEQKLAFLRTHVPKQMKLVFIGHSIGSYISLQMLKNAPELPVILSVMLFPTIEWMSESPNGRIATPFLCWLRYVLYAIAYILLKPLPENLKSWIISMTFQLKNIANDCFCPSLLNPFCLANAAYLGGQEMIQMVERDNETIKKHLSKLTFYYGSIDSWCPLQYYENIKRDFPEGDIRLCEKKIPHAFILSHSEEVAEMTAAWLKDDLSKI